MFTQFNPNPKGSRVGDCTVRAISKALGMEWEHVYIWLCLYGFMMADMPSANHVCGAFLQDQGFSRGFVSNKGRHDYSVRDFCVDNPRGVYILMPYEHVVCAIDGNYYDSWDSGDEIPLYYWTKEEK